MKEPNANIDKQTYSQDDLLDGLAAGDNSDLKMFLNRGPRGLKLPQNFLWIDKNNFGKVKVTDIWYSGNTVIMVVGEYRTGIVREIHVDINEEQDFQMIRWQDIIEMVKNEEESLTNDDTLLEFEF